jgi:hypothetical protein
VLSWGDSCSGADPYIEELVDKYFESSLRQKVASAISACSWWIEDSPMLRILKQQDSFAASGAEGFAAPLWDFEKQWLV